ncbi:hypothetical protein BHE74_00045372 [Ensete ventricosum]|nr:hypothetical protein BHE74_00045372 [Ensete ventricosum]
MEVTCDPARGESLEEKKRRKKAQDHCAPCEITPGFFACCTSAIHAVIVINPLTFPGRPLPLLSLLLDCPVSVRTSEK